MTTKSSEIASKGTPSVALVSSVCGAATLNLSVLLGLLVLVLIGGVLLG